MKICIISDLHCKYQFDVSASSETLLFSNMPRKPFTQHPVASMLKTIEKDNSIKSDFLLCTGDLSDRADEQGITSAWSFIEEIRQKLGAKIKVGIPGNHDINSRRILGKDAFSYIKNFHESFPTNDEDLNTKFWEKGYCIQTYDESLFLLINTVHDHECEEKAGSSNIKKDTLEEIEKEIASRKLDSVKYKICILHHHPIKHSNIQNWKDSDSLDNGDDLLSMLNVNDFNLVIHGHKHQPRICEQNSLTIFAAGSFSSFANLQGTNIQTMFHVIEFDKNRKVGTVCSWEYNVKEGWSINLNKYFPPIIGFGGVVDLDKVAKSIYQILSEAKTPILYSEILNEFPDLLYLIPEKLVKLGEILKREYNLSVSPNYPLQPNLITFLK